MGAKTPQQATAKWVQRAGAATQALQDGINGVTVAPSQLAIAKQDKMLQNLTNSILSGKWAANLGAVTLAQWKDAMLTKGVQRYGAGVTAAQPKMLAFMQRLIPYQQQLQQQIQAMPDLTLDDAIARSAAFIRGMSQFPNK